MTGLAVLGTVFALIYGWVGIHAMRNRLLARLAAREAARRPVQSLLVVAGLMIASASITASLVGADSVGDSAVLNAYRQWGKIDLMVRAPGDGYFAPAIAQHLAGDPNVGGVTRGVAGGVEVVGSAADLDRKQGESGVTLVGFDPSAQRPFDGFVLQGASTTTYGELLGDGEVYLSSGLAGSLAARVGDRLQLQIETLGAVSCPGGTSPGACPRAEAAPLRVAGIATAQGFGAYTLGPTVFASLETTKRLTGTTQINVIRISASADVKMGAGAGKVAGPTIRRALEGTGLGLREVKAAEVKAAQDSSIWIRSMLVAMSALIVAAGAALAVNIVAMLAEERRSRLGVLRALGLKRRGLIRLSVFEGALYSLAAALVGTTLGIFAGRLVATRFAAAFASFTPDAFDFSFVFSLRPETVGAAFSVGAILTLSVVYVASRRTSRMSIPAAIRNLPEPAEQRKRSWIRIAGRVLFSLLGAGMLVGNALSRLVGGIVLLLVISGIVKPRLSPRAHASIMGAAVALWSFTMIWFSGSGTETDEDPGLFFAVFVVAMLSSVFGFSILASANLRLAERTIGLLGHAFAGLRPILRPPLAYLARRPVRTGLTTGVFGVILGMLMLFAVFQFIFKPNYEQGAAGYEIRATSTGSQQIQIPPDVSSDVAGTVEIPTRGYVGSFSSADGFSGERVFLPLFEMTGGLIANPPVYIAQRDKKYDSDREMWDAVARDPKLIVFAFGSPGTTLKLGEREYKIAGSQGSVLYGIMGSPEAFETFKSAPAGTTMLVDVREGADATRIARAIEAAGFGSGVDAVTTKKILDDEYEGMRTFFSVLDILMRMGLIVGILALGIVAMRAVIERRHVIGVLRAMGYKRRAVLGGLMAEAASSAMIGTVVGVSAGTVMGYIFYKQDEVAGATFGVNAPAILGSLLLLFVAVLVVTAGPAYRASRLPPAEAVRYSE